MDILQCFFEDRYANEIAYDAIDFIFSAFENRLVEIEQEKLEIPKATELAMLKLEALIQLATIQYDGKVHPEEVFEKFDPDGEPYPNTIDSWARGMGKSISWSYLFDPYFIVALFGFTLINSVHAQSCSRRE
jgi:hypothetical protein